MSKKDPVSVNIVESQVIELLERYKKLKEENVQLKRDLETALTNLDDAKSEIIKLQTNYNRLKLAKAYGWDEKSKREANLRISQLVRDIDKCLGLLNSID